MTTQDGLNMLKKANPNLSYTLTEDLRYRVGELSGNRREASEYYVHVHYGDDGADRKNSKMWNGEDLADLIGMAISFIKNNGNL